MRPEKHEAIRKRFTGYSGDDFVESGKGLVNVLASTSGLTACSNVLDIGSGIGRLAIPLTQLITSPGSYDGLEIVERGVHWCTRNITPMHPHFRFTHANIFNAEYNPGGTVKAAEYEYVRSLYARNGLHVSGFYVGSWSGRPGAPEVEWLGQDLVVGSKQ